jgi:xanthine/uracil permease
VGIAAWAAVAAATYIFYGSGRFITGFIWGSFLVIGAFALYTLVLNRLWKQPDNRPRARYLKGALWRIPLLCIIFFAVVFGLRLNPGGILAGLTAGIAVITVAGLAWFSKAVKGTQK